MCCELKRAFRTLDESGALNDMKKVDRVLMEAQVKDTEKMDERMTKLENTVFAMKEDVVEVKSEVVEIKDMLKLFLEKVDIAPKASKQELQEQVTGSIVHKAVKNKMFWVGVAVVLVLCIGFGFGITAIFSNPDATAKIANSVIK